MIRIARTYAERQAADHIHACRGCDESVFCLVDDADCTFDGYCEYCDDDLAADYEDQDALSARCDRCGAVHPGTSCHPAFAVTDDGWLHSPVA